MLQPLAPGKPEPVGWEEGLGLEEAGDMGRVGCSPPQGDPTGAVMRGPGGTEGGPGKLPMELVPCKH